MALTDVIISRRGGVSPVVTMLNDVRVSWEINHAGMLTGGIPVSLLASLNLPLYDLRGYWLWWEHPLIGGWSGVITSTTGTSARVVQITAESHHVQFKKKFQAATGGVRYQTPYWLPGQLFRHMYNEASGSAASVGDSIWLTLGSVEAGHQPITVDWMLSDYYDNIIPSLTSNIDYEWDVSYERVITYARRLGSDKRSTVRIAEGVEIADYSLTTDLWEITNTMLGLGTYSTRDVTKTHIATKHDNPIFRGNVKIDYPSIAQYGLLADYRDFGYIAAEWIIDPLLTNELLRERNPPASLTVMTVPFGTYWRNIRQGDIIRVVLSSIGRQVDFRVMVRAFDSATGILTMSGEAWLDGYQLLPNVFVPGLFGTPPPNELVQRTTKKKKNKNRPGRGRPSGGGGGSRRRRGR